MDKNTRLVRLDRRAALCKGGAVAFSTLLTSLLGGNKPARAQSLTSTVPEVDRVAGTGGDRQLPNSRRAKHQGGHRGDQPLRLAARPAAAG